MKECQINYAIWWCATHNCELTEKGQCAKSVKPKCKSKKRTVTTRDKISPRMLTAWFKKNEALVNSLLAAAGYRIKLPSLDYIQKIKKNYELHQKPARKPVQ